MYFKPGVTTEEEREGFVIKKTEVTVSDTENITEFIVVRTGRKESLSALSCGIEKL